VAAVRLRRTRILARACDASWNDESDAVDDLQQHQWSPRIDVLVDRILATAARQDHAGRLLTPGAGLRPWRRRLERALRSIDRARDRASGLLGGPQRR
jgi:hypothetical protein